jgi:tRNA pseudouridine38-40 synthase
MPRYRLILAYDGTDFCGWQKQEPVVGGPEARPALIDPDQTGVPDGRVALRTVQHAVEQTVRRVVREPLVLVGASRTDAGVHAWGQAAAFTSRPEPDRGVGWPAERGCDTLVRALNSRLPEDIIVRAVDVVRDDFDPISDAVEKEYAYTIRCADDRPLWDRRRVWALRHALDAGAMHEAARHLVGTHDFASFTSINQERASTVRTIFACAVTAGASELDAAPRVVVRIRGDGFLYNMVRIVVGTLVQVGLGRQRPEWVREVLEARERTRAGNTAPPEGLCLEWVRYDDAAPPGGRPG